MIDWLRLIFWLIGAVLGMRAAPPACDSVTGLVLCGVGGVPFFHFWFKSKVAFCCRDEETVAKKECRILVFFLRVGSKKRISPARLASLLRHPSQVRSYAIGEESDAMLLN